MDTFELAHASARVLHERSGVRPDIGIICGTGFGPASGVLDDRVTVPFEDLPGFRPSAIPSHVNEVDMGSVGGVPVAVVKAKVLPCDGATWQESGIPARTLAAAGCRTLLYMAHSGSMREDVPPGGFLAFTDHINFAGINPLAWDREGSGWPTPYMSMSELYDVALTAAFVRAVEAAGVAMPTGVAGFWMGPSFETPAEIRMAKAAGCSISSNSFLPEVMAGHHAGMRVVAFTYISTMSAGIASPITMTNVVESAARSHEDFRTIVRAAVPVLAAAS